jgi:hypothetical protein
MHNAVAPTAHVSVAHLGARTRRQCPACKEQFEAGKSACYCEELHRRKTYDEERSRRGLVALYRPPSMR